MASDNEQPLPPAHIRQQCLNAAVLPGPAEIKSLVGLAAGSCFREYK
jgi:hypothetical protein